jgi:hypothetical protein
MNNVCALLRPPPTLAHLPPPWRFVHSSFIVDNFNVSSSILAKWRKQPCSPRWAYDHSSKSFWYQPGTLLLWAHQFEVSEEEIVAQWFADAIPNHGFEGSVSRFEAFNARTDKAPLHLRWPSPHAVFAADPAREY